MRPCRTLAMLFALVLGAICAIAQIDPAAGKTLSADLETEQVSYLSALQAWNAINPWTQKTEMQGGRPYKSFGPKVFEGTLDAQMIEKHLSQCRMLLASARQDVRALDYERGGRELTEIHQRLAAVGTILTQLRDSPVDVIRSESRVDEQTAPVKDLPPNLSGPALRGLIASELSFAERLTSRAAIDEDAPAILQYGEPKNQCTFASAEFMTATTQTAHEVGVGTEYRFLSPEKFFMFARSELYLLRYDSAHKMAYSSFVEAQKVLAVCDRSRRTWRK